MTRFAGWVDTLQAPDPASQLAHMLGALTGSAASGEQHLLESAALGCVGSTGSAALGTEPVWTAVDGYPLEARDSAAFDPRATPAERVRRAYLREGQDALRGFHGAFAVVVWDSRSKRLLLARDPTGMRRLYYARFGDGLAFASEIRSLLTHPRVRRELERDGLPEYVGYRYASGPATLFSGISVLEPGCFLLWENGSTRVEPYWDLPYETDEGECTANARTWSGRVEQALCRATAEAFRDGRRTGVLLSGGLDSSLLTAFAAPLAPRPLRTWSVGLEDPALDESPRAWAVARALHTAHVSRRVTAAEYAWTLPETVAANEQPLHHPNSVALLVVAREAAHDIDALIMGEGADSSFGNRAARKLLLFERLSGVAPRPVVRSACRFLGTIGLRRFRQLYELLRQDPERFIVTSNLFTPAPLVRELLGLDDDEPLLAARRRYLEGHDAWPLLARLLYYYQKTELVASFDVFGKVLAHAGIEPEMPFGDRSVQEVSCRVPVRLKATLRQAKPLLFLTARPHLPREVLRWPKMSFGFPLGAWLRPGGALEPYVRLLGQARTGDRGLLRPEVLARVLAEHRDGRADHGEAALWTAINLELWARLFLDGQATESLLDDLRALGLGRTD